MRLGFGMGVGLGDGALDGLVIARARPGNYAAIGGVSSFTRADPTTCASYRDAAGLLQTVVAGVLRDAAYVGSVRTILLESTSNNPVLWSNDLTQAGSWSPINVAAAKNAIGPDGVANSATTLTATATAGVRMIQVAGSMLAGQKAVMSVLLKRGTSAFATFYDSNDAAVHKAWFDMVNAAFGTTSGLLSTGVEAYGGGWYRGWIIFQATNNYNLKTDVDLSSTDGGVNGTNGTTLLVHGVMAERNKAFPSSVIATGAAAVIRATDALTFAGTSLYGGTSTLFYRYFDLLTRAWVNLAAAYTPGDPITPAVDRAYADIVILRGTLSTAAAAAVLGY